MSDTPRTDTFKGKCHSYHKNEHGRTLIEEAELLERELAEADQRTAANYQRAVEAEQQLDQANGELAEAQDQRDKLRIIYSEIIASVRVNFMRGMFQQATQEQIDEWCEQQLNKIPTKGGQP